MLVCQRVLLGRKTHPLWGSTTGNLAKSHSMAKPRCTISLSRNHIPIKHVYINLCICMYKYIYIYIYMYMYIYILHRISSSLHPPRPLLEDVAWGYLPGLTWVHPKGNSLLLLAFSREAEKPWIFLTNYHQRRFVSRVPLLIKSSGMSRFADKQLYQPVSSIFKQ